MRKKSRPTKRKRESTEFKKFQQFVESTINEIRNAHGMKDFEMHYQFYPKIKEAPHNKVILAQIDIDKKYLTAEVIIHQPLFDHYKAGNIDLIRNALCHEMAHVRTVGLERLAQDRWACPEDIERESENITELMGRMMFKLLYVKPIIKKKK